MKTVFLFLAKLLVFSLLLYAVHKPLIMAYEFVLLGIIFQFPTSNLMPPGQYYDSSLWLIPTIVLILAIPRLTWQKRSLMLLLGVVAYWSLDLISFFFWITPPLPNVQASEIHYLYSMVWKTTGQWVLPFLIWFIAAYRQVGEFIEARS